MTTGFAGRLFTLAVGDGGGSETFATIAECRATSLSLNQAAIDITTKADSFARTLLDAAGVKSASISADGVFDDSASYETMRGLAVAQTLRNYRITMPNNDTYTMKCKVTSLQLTGSHDGELTFSITLESSGAITFAAA
jgi:TP901-1 family phage major tail protein